MNNHTFKSRFMQQLRAAVDQSSSGQIIILMAFGMIVLLAAAGLAIDGGRMIYLKRSAQNAVDAALIASAHALCLDAPAGEVIAAGELAASQNGYNSSNSTVTVLNPPPATHAMSNNDEYVYITIDTQIQPFFMQLIGREDAGATAAGTAHCDVDVITVHSCSCDPDLDDKMKYSVFGGDASCSDPVVYLSGDSNTINGVIHSNQNFRINGDDNASWYVTYKGSRIGSNSMYTPAGGNLSLHDINKQRAWPRTFDIDSCSDLVHDFSFDGASVAENVNCWEYNGSVEITDSSPDGIYISTGDISFRGSMGDAWHHRHITAIARNRVQFSDDNLTIYNDSFIGDGGPNEGLLAYSEYGSNCSTAAISLSGSNNTIVGTGIFYAENGQINLSESGLNLDGCLIGSGVSISGDDNEITYNQEFCNPSLDGSTGSEERTISIAN